MRVADNHTGWHVQVFTGPEGWKPAQADDTGKPLVFTREEADYKALVLKSLCPKLEFRVYEAVQ